MSAGRPTKLDDIRAKKILDAIKAGASRRAAANAAGLSRDALQNWIKRGEEGDAEFSDFAYRVRLADAEAEQAHTRVVVEASLAGDLKASIFWLQSQRREEWGAGALQPQGQRADVGAADLEADGALIESIYAAYKSRAAK